MSEYRPPSPFSPKPDYKSMDIEQIKKHAMRYGLSTTQAKGRLIKILDEIYNVTHQYETDTDYEFDTNYTSPSKHISNKKDLSHTPPTPAITAEIKKPKQRKAIHQMSSSDESDEPSRPPASTRLISTKQYSPIITVDDDNDSNDNKSSDDDIDSDHEGRFLELTVHDLSSTPTSSSSLSLITTPSSATLSNNDLFNGSPSNFFILSLIFNL